MELVFLAVLVIGLVGSGLWWLAKRAWGLAFRPYSRDRDAPDARQIANQQAAEAYDQYHPRIGSVRFVRRRTWDHNRDDR